MTVNTMQEHLKLVEKDHSRLAKEGDKKIQELREDKYRLKVKEHDRPKKKEIDKVEVNGRIIN